MATDKRVIKTRKAITNAFMELTLEKDIRKITVSDIAEKAVINRSTFYLHYSDAKDVLDDIEKNISQAIYGSFERFDTSDIFGSTYDMFITFTRVLDQTPPFKNFMLHSTSSGYIISNIKRIFIENAIKASLQKSQRQMDINLLRLSITYMVAGIIDSYIQWAMDESENKLPLDEYCRRISRVTERVVGLIN